MKELKGNYGTKDYGELKKRKRKYRKRNKGDIFIVLFFLAIILLGIINAVRVYSSAVSGKAKGGSVSGVYQEKTGKGLSSDKKSKTVRGKNNQAEKSTDINNPLSEEEAGKEESDDGDWRLTLINKWHPISRNYTITLINLSRGHAVDERCYPYLQQMMDDCRSAGFFPLICSSYRTWKKQENLYINQVNELAAQGYTREEAEDLAKTSNAVPGTSEHQLGLAVDIVDSNYQMLDEKQETTPVQKWLMENCWKYGFILRYPNGKSNITGIIYEPWHYRYVGVEAASEIYKKGICLEEYLGETELSD